MLRAPRWRLAGLLAVALCSGLGSIGGSIPAAAASSPWTDATVAPPSERTALRPIPTSMACAAAGSCVAVGSYSTGSNSFLGLVLTEASGSWSAAEAPLPSGALILDQHVDLDSVSCSSSTSCVAVGMYYDTSGNTEGLLLTDSSGSWSAAEAPLPSGAAPSSLQDVDLGSLSCVSATSCLAAGSYLDTSGKTQGLLLTDSSGSWSPAEAPLPSGAVSSGQDVALGSLSCVSVTSCVAVGSYLDSSGNTQGLLLTDSSGSWSAAEAPLASGAVSSGQDVELGSVACTSSTSCLAVGSYKASSKSSMGVQGLLLTDSSGSWSAAAAPLPSGALASGQVVALDTLTCTSATSCLAAGSYKASSGAQGLLLTDSSGSWSAAAAPLPSGALGSSQVVALETLTCTSSSGGSSTTTTTGPTTSTTSTTGPTTSTTSTTGPTTTTTTGPATSTTSTTGPTTTTTTGPATSTTTTTGPATSTSTTTVPATSTTTTTVPSTSTSCLAAGSYTASSGVQGLLLTDSSGSWSAAEATLPSGAATSSQDVELSSAACVSSTTCGAVGSYVDSSGRTQGLLLGETSGAWSATEGPVPPGASPSPGASPYAVSCTSSTSCVAVGSYGDTSGNFQGLLLTETSGSWSAAEAPLPSGADTSEQYAYLDALYCVSSSSCAAVGSYLDGSQYYQGLLLTDSSGSWSATEAPLPSGADTSLQLAQFSSVSCASSSSCVAVGNYLDTSLNLQGALLTDTSGSWSAAKSPLPSGAVSSGQDVQFDSLTCLSSTSCLAVGSYFDSSGNTEGLLLTDTSGSWSAATAPLPSGARASSQVVALDALTCTSSTSCLAVGSYLDSSGNTQGLLVTDSSGSWSAAKATLPAGAATSGQDVELNSASCVAAGCAAVGNYLDSSGNTQGLLLIESQGAWSATEASLPTAGASNPDAEQDSVSCVTSVICTAVGDYFDANAGEHALFESYAPPGLVLGPPTLSWSVSLGGYDLSASSPVVLDVDNLGNAGWDLTIEASGLPSNGSEELASPTLNGSSSSSGATTAPQQSCVGSCTSASGNTVTYPLAIPVGVPADLYNAAVGTGTGELALATYWWVAVPADTYASVGAYSAIVTLTVSSGP